INGQTQEPEKAQFAQMREMMYIDRVVRLVPLLVERGFRLTTSKEAKVNDRPAVGVKVASDGHKDVTLYFDKDSGLLIKAEHQVVNHQKKEVLQEEYFSEFKDVGGFKRPTRVVAFQEGKKVMDGELTDIKYFDSVPDSEFAKP